MFTEKRPTGLKLVVFLAFINALFTMVHFVLLDKGVLHAAGLVGDLWVSASSVTIAAVLPSVIGAYGLYHKRMWGLGYLTLGNGAYICSSLLILLLSIKTNQLSIMFYASIYLIVFSLFTTVYSWMLRQHFREF